jgi:DNA-binding CsgD family transcriptional regulator
MSKRNSLTLPDIRNVFRLLNEMQELKTDRRLGRHNLIQGLCGLLSARQGVSLCWSGFSSTGQLKLLEFVGGGWASPEAAALWEQAMNAAQWRGDPVLNQATCIAGDVRAFRRCELVCDEDFHASEVYNQISKHSDTDDLLVGWFRHGQQDQVTGLSFQRSWGDRRFSPRQREILRLVVSELQLLHKAGKLDPAPTGLPALPPRLAQLLTELLSGKSEKQIAATMCLSKLTVNDYVKRLYRRLDVQSRPELMAQFIQPAPQGDALRKTLIVQRCAIHNSFSNKDFKPASRQT